MRKYIMIHLLQKATLVYGFRKAAHVRHKFALVDAIQKTENVLFCLGKLFPFLSSFLKTRITNSETCSFRKKVKIFGFFFIS